MAMRRRKRRPKEWDGLAPCYAVIYALSDEPLPRRSKKKHRMIAITKMDMTQRIIMERV